VKTLLFEFDTLEDARGFAQAVLSGGHDVWKTGMHVELRISEELEKFADALAWWFHGRQTRLGPLEPEALIV